MQDSAAAAVSAALGKLLTSLLLIGVSFVFVFFFFVENDLENLQPKCTNNTDCFQEGEEEAVIT